MRGVLALAILVLAWLAPAPAQAATPAFSVHKNGTAQTIVGDTPTKLTWSTEVIDTNTNFATDRFTPTIAGNYLIVVSVQCAQPGACVPAIYKNGALYAASRLTNQTFADQSPHVTAIVSMNGSTDYVEAFATSSGSSIAGGATQTYFSGSQIDGGGSSGGSGGNTMVLGWPDAIRCTDGAESRTFIMTIVDATRVTYRDSTAGANDTIQFNPANGAYASQSGYGSSDCVTGTKSIATLYAEGKAFNFIGNGSASAAGSSGQIQFHEGGNLQADAGLYWDNSNKRVGIGTTSPTSKLQIDAGGTAGSSVDAVVVNGGVAGAAGSGSRIYLSGGSGVSRAGFIEGINTSGANNGYALTFGTSSPTMAPVERMRIDLSGNVGIGTTNPTSKLDVNGSIGTTGVITLTGAAGATALPFLQWYRGATRVAFMGWGQSSGPAWGNRLDIAMEGGAHLGITGNVAVLLGNTVPSYSLQSGGVIAGAGAYVNTSDARLKKDVGDLDYGLETVMRLRPVSFHWNIQKDDWQKGRKLGLIAQEVEQVVPEIVSTAFDEMKTKSIAYGDATPILIKAIQQLKADNDNLRAELRETNNSQDAEIEGLRRELKALQTTP